MLQRGENQPSPVQTWDPMNMGDRVKWLLLKPLSWGVVTYTTLGDRNGCPINTKIATTYRACPALCLLLTFTTSLHPDVSIIK